MTQPEPHNRATAQPQPIYDSVSTKEVIAVGLGMAAQGLVVARWYIGSTIPSLIVQTVIEWLVVLFAIAAGVSLDFAVVVTLMSRREGRRSVWSQAAAISATMFSAAIALDVYGGPTLGPWLHVANAVTTYCLVQHLAAPKSPATNGNDVNVDSLVTPVDTILLPVSTRPRRMQRRNRRQLPPPIMSNEVATPAERLAAQPKRNAGATIDARVDDWLRLHNNGAGLSYQEISKQNGGQPSRQYISKQCELRRRMVAATKE